MNALLVGSGGVLTTYYTGCGGKWYPEIKVVDPRVYHKYLVTYAKRVALAEEQEEASSDAEDGGSDSDENVPDTGNQDGEVKVDDPEDV